MSSVIVYLRKSTENGQTYSLEAQEASIRAFCDRSGFNIEKVFFDISSGTNDHREGLKEAVKMASACNFPIVVLRVDRLSRNPSKIFKLLENPNLKIIISELGLEGDMFLIGQLALYAQLELSLLKKRTKEGLERAKARGVKLGNPRWKESVEAREAGKQRHANEQALRLKNIVMPLYETLGSYRAVARALNEMEIRTNRGKPFSGNTIKAVIDRLIMMKEVS